MTNTIRLTNRSVRLFLLILSIVSCQDNVSEYYEDHGNAATITVVDVLNSREDFSLFSQLIEKSTYEEILSSTGLFTLLLPDNQAMVGYFTSLGIEGVDDFPEEKIDPLIESHLLDFSYTVYRLSHGPDTYDPEMIRRSSRFALPLREVSFTTFYDDGKDPSSKEYLVYSENKMHTFYTSDFFSTIGVGIENLDPFFHGSSAKLSEGKTFVSGATLKEVDIPAINGWVHVIDKVMEPQLNHREKVEAEEKYNLFAVTAAISSAPLYSSYYTDKIGLGEETGIADSLFLMDWFTLDSEFIGKTGERPSNDEQRTNVQKQASTVLVPTNDAFSAFLNQYYGEVYEDLPEDLPHYVVSELAENFIFQNEMVWPEQLENGEMKDKFGFPVQYGKDAIEEYFAASNGLFYGVNHIQTPAKLECVTNEMMTDSTYRAFNLLLKRAGFLDALVSKPKVAEYTVLLADNQTFADYNIEVYELELAEGTTDPDEIDGNTYGYFVKGDQLTGLKGTQISVDKARFFAANHILRGRHDLSNLTSPQFFETIGSGYVAVYPASANGSDALSVANGEELTLENQASYLTKSSKDLLNGNTYVVDNLVGNQSQRLAAYLQNTEEYIDFSNLLMQAELLSDDGKFLFWQDNYTTCFAPDNSAFTEEILAELEAMEIEDLKKWLGTFFVGSPIFSDGQNQGTFYCTQTESVPVDVSGHELNVEVTNGQITVSDTKGNSTITEAYQDVLTKDGVVHNIKTLFNR